MRIKLAFITLVALPCLSAATFPPSLDNDLDIALGTAGLDKLSARFDTGIMRFYQESEFQTPFYRSCHENPWRTPFYAEQWKRQFKGNVADPSETLATAGRMLGVGTQRSLLGNPIQSAIDAGIKANALRATLESMKKRGLLNGAIPDLGGVPGTVQEGAAVVLQVAMQSIGYRRATFADAPDFSKLFDRAIQDKIETADAEQNQSDLNFYRKVDMRYLLAAGGDLVAATKHAQVVIQSTDPSAKYKVTIPTYWGKIVLSGGTNDTYPNEPTLLVIDTGGSDTYINGASNRSVLNWFSAVIDTAGNDAYVSDPALANTPIASYSGRKAAGPYGPASALCGVSVLIDSDGKDLYRSHRPGLASSFMGASYLEDSTGDDTYDGYSSCQGSARFGVAVLEDWKGNDTYRSFTYSQGFGGVLGMGMLMDRLGDDKFEANVDMVEFPSPQSAQQNMSMSQGAASGRRADYLDGHSLSGGIGVLLDEDGDDAYTCAVFGQGVGYWEGCGMLWDEGGKDNYEGAWYVQGASAHFGIGVLEDGGGDDQLTATMSSAQGIGHDFGVGFLMNWGGNDKYKAPNLSLGAGNANGMGICMDSSGDDTYETSGITLGRSSEAPKGSLRERALTLGVFVDGGGNDIYPAAMTWAQNARRLPNWTDRRTPANESQAGIFWDR
ncbi:MAG: hypothetical protein JNM85_00905 [Chthonomonas sp.]|nr:hypothetical protein [Chthonomonas sp.]